MRKYEGKPVAILITVIIHLIAGIIFMIIRIGDLHIKEYKREYEVALQAEPEKELKQMDNQSRVYSVEQVVRGDQELQNIARNLANQPDVKINKDDYIDKVKEELIESGKLGKDNYIDDQKKAKENGTEIPVSAQDKKSSEQKDKSDKNANELASKYSGPTRIYYNLPGRTHTYLPLPIYKCEGDGKVVLQIEVNPKGDVTNASVITAESTATDPCLVETAVNTALISHFNPDIKAVKNESGTLTYLFVAQ
jgi:vacuolar-type H+-ATPase subunit I/STV1